VNTTEKKENISTLKDKLARAQSLILAIFAACRSRATPSCGGIPCRRL